MSRVTNAVILVDTLYEIDEVPAGLLGELPFVTDKWKDVERFHMMDESVSEWTGGYKSMEISTFMCAFNYLSSEEDLINWFRALPWRNEDYATLIISLQEGGFTVYLTTP